MPILPFRCLRRFLFALVKRGWQTIPQPEDCDAETTNVPLHTRRMMRVSKALLAGAFGAALLLSQSPAAQAQAVASAADGGCRPAYTGNGFVSVYPCISKSGTTVIADAYADEMPSACAYYKVSIVSGAYDTVWTTGPEEACSRAHSGRVRLYNARGTFRSKITTYDRNDRSIGSLESPNITVP
ncbi:hypothetical protein [Nonomuraea sp. NPDC023979]|uniref:hypothetical protein n=1 Tax=Nonomuraea sp. NPDC023979 TaxID=3154796 RepID=UPI0033F880C1